MADYLLLALSIVLSIIGILGCILPVLPGPPMNWLALLLLNFTHYASFSLNFLLIFAAITLVVTLLDYIIPLWGTKKFGGSKAGVWGATIGMLVGVFFLPPIGLIIGPFAGALIGEIIAGKSSSGALKASLGTLLGFFIGIGLKLACSLTMTFYLVKELIS